MEKEKSLLTRIENDLKLKMSKLIECESKELPSAFRALNESVSSYCAFRSLLDQYNENESAG